MTEQEAFFAAITANPRDDTPRLVYADWLEEHGDPERADFIRLDIAYGLNADAKGDLSPTEGARLAERREELLTRNREKWSEPLRELGVPSWGRDQFERGFEWFENTTIPAEVFVARGDRLLRAMPVLRLRLSAPGAVGRGLAECPHLARINNLVLNADPPLSRGDLRALLESPHAANLHRLHLSGYPLGDDELTDFASTSATGLRSLSFGGGRFTGATLPVITSRCGELEELDLSCIETFDPTNIAALSAPGLQRLSFENTPVGAPGMRALAGARELTGLATLSCMSAGLDAAAMEALATATHLRLSAIWFHYDRLTTRGGAALAAWPGLASLRTLALDSCALAGGGVAAIARSPHLGALEKLTLSCNRMGDIGAEALARCDRLQALRELDVQSNKITDRGVRALASARLPRLRMLQLEHNRSGEEGGKAILGAEHLNELRWLTLDEVSESLSDQLLRRFPKLTAFGAGAYAFAHGPGLEALRAKIGAVSS